MLHAMPARIILALLATLTIIRSAAADDKYTFRENLHVNQMVPYAMTYDCKIKSTATTGGKQTSIDSETRQIWKVTLTILAEENGSATRARADVGAESVDTFRITGQSEEKIPCPFAGRSIILTRHSDETITNDFQGKASGDDLDMLNNFLVPDDDFYPDKPVAVGDMWDNSAKLSRHAELGPKDQLLSECRLDWVKTIDGKRMAQISNSVATIYHEDGNVEEDTGYTTTILVDIAAGVIVKGDEKGSSKYITTAKEPTQVTGGTEFTFHSEVLPDAATGAATKP